MEREILLIFEKSQMADMLIRDLTSKGYIVKQIWNKEQINELTDDKNIGVVVADIETSQKNGMELIKYYKDINKNAHVIALSDTGKINEILYFINKISAFRVYEFPLDIELVLLPAVEEAFNSYEINRLNTKSENEERENNQLLKIQAEKIKNIVETRQDSVDYLITLADEMMQCNCLMMDGISDEDKVKLLNFQKNIIKFQIKFALHKELTIVQMRELMIKMYSDGAKKQIVGFKYNIEDIYKSKNVNDMNYIICIIIYYISLISIEYKIIVTISYQDAASFSVEAKLKFIDQMLDQKGQGNKLTASYNRIIDTIIGSLTEKYNKKYDEDCLVFTMEMRKE